ncbi:hypothetical protein MAR_034278 [Mya arenaria]|uniref:Reverse transcriptase domain-containing protein n=1 Tax=Mya arenaria TaxID=6604 RepID=A0ABY7GJR7_MYAAR|nr:hypothetical protein MAR_034278 [Mya arenaria]
MSESDVEATSKIYPEKGIRQGAKLSPTLYKAYNNDILDALDKSKIGAKIGTVFAGAPTVADDIALLATDPIDLSAALQIVHHFNCKDRANINTTKSEIVIFNTPNRRTPESWNIGEGVVKETTSTIHLGIQRHQQLQQNIPDRIATGRGALYALMGAGLHGRNGINPTTSFHMYKTFARPRIIYGLESVKLTQKDLQQLEKFELKVLRQIQYLPDRCSSIPVYSLLGATPITSQIEVNALTLFSNICRSPETTEYAIAKRQLAVKDADSHSWFIGTRQILNKYNLPSAFELLQAPPSPKVWKNTVKDAVDKYWRDKWVEDQHTKSSLKYFKIQDKPASTPHPLWRSIDDNPRQVREAVVKARVLTGTYTLQANKHKFNQHDVNPSCPLCHTGSENREHFLTHCPALALVRKKYLSRLSHTLTSKTNANIADHILANNELLLQCITDCTACPVKDIIGNSEQVVHSVEDISRSLIYDLHCKRNAILKGKLQQNT